MKHIRLVLIIIIVLAIGQVYAQKKQDFLSNYLELTVEQLNEIGFIEKGQCLIFRTMIQARDYTFNICDDKFETFINGSNLKQSEKQQSYFPVIVAETSGKIHFTSSIDKTNNKSFLPILVKTNTKLNGKKQYIFLFDYNNELSQKLSDIKDIDRYLVNDVSKI
ncbi:MAG: hypothetical protein GY834_15905 [Bacteroidetes bacterium]|nr:hypothetical protein [Bacteroidota bacterium]